MDLSNVSAKKRELLSRIEENERLGNFDATVEEDPPSKPLLPSEADYLCKRLSSKIKRRVANFIADSHFKKMIKKGVFVLENVEGREHLSALKKGAIITCNHFSPFDNYMLFHAIRKELPRKYLYKIIKESNYTAFPGLYGFFFRHCNTLPLSSNRRTMIDFMSSVQTLLKRGESILVYPEQEMWWNYRKPRPFKVGGFKLAYRAGVPVLPMFFTMRDDETRLDGDGYPLQIHTLHILNPIYPDSSLGEKKGAEKMMEEAYALCKAKYEEIYKKPLVFTCDNEKE